MCNSAEVNNVSRCNLGAIHSDAALLFMEYCLLHMQKRRASVLSCA